MVITYQQKHNSELQLALDRMLCFIGIYEYIILADDLII